MKRAMVLAWFKEPVLALSSTEPLRVSSAFTGSSMPPYFAAMRAFAVAAADSDLGF